MGVEAEGRCRRRELGDHRDRDLVAVGGFGGSGGLAGRGESADVVLYSGAANEGTSLLDNIEQDEPHSTFLQLVLIEEHCGKNWLAVVAGAADGLEFDRDRGRAGDIKKRTLKRMVSVSRALAIANRRTNKRSHRRPWIDWPSATRSSAGTM